MVEIENSGAVATRKLARFWWKRRNHPASSQRYFDTASTSLTSCSDSRIMTLILDTSRCSAGLFLAASSCFLESVRDVGAD
jgi:hypothetical protein